MRAINEHAVKLAVEEKFADPKVAVADTTAQEAAIPYPNEMGLMSKFLASMSKTRLKGYGKVAHEKVKSLHETMKKLLPQIRGWLKTGKVATGKIVNLFIPELYSIVRGKTGKAVEFGLKWGIERLKGGFVLARVAEARGDLHDSEYAVEAVKDHEKMFGKVPRAYAFDRGGYSQENVKELKELGVKEVGLAPRGRAKWSVKGKAKERLASERPKVEGSIGTIKGRKYGFNRPGARSVEMMGACGQRAVLGLNLNNLVRKMAKREGWAMEC